MSKLPRQTKRAKSIKEEMTNLALLLVSWGNYKPTHPYHQIQREYKLSQIRKRLAELNEENNSLK